MGFGKGKGHARKPKHSDHNTRELRPTEIPALPSVATTHPKHNASQARKRRIAAAVFFIDRLGAPSCLKWGGRDGAISTIIKQFGWPKKSRNVVRRVLEAVVKCARAGTEYDGHLSMGSGGHNKLIMLDSPE